jgi:hypothetical protein
VADEQHRGLIIFGEIIGCGDKVVQIAGKPGIHESAFAIAQTCEVEAQDPKATSGQLSRNDGGCFAVFATCKTMCEYGVMSGCLSNRQFKPGAEFKSVFIWEFYAFCNHYLLLQRSYSRANQRSFAEKHITKYKTHYLSVAKGDL